MKRKLLLALLLASGAMGGVKMSAQTWTDVTSTYITNPSFESDGLVNSGGSNGTLATLTGWTETESSLGNFSTTMVCDASTKNADASETSKLITPKDGTYYLYWRHGWNSSNTATFTSTAASLPAGVYTLSVDYKMTETYDNTSRKTTSIALSAINGENTLASKSATVTTTYSGNDGGHLSSDDWSTLEFVFAVSAVTSTQVKIVLTATGQKRSDFVIDNVKLTQLSVSNGDDMTSFITNAAVASTTGWTNGRSGTNQQYTGAPDNTYLDTWNATLDQNQTVTLPAGYYLLKAATRASAGITGGTIYAYVSEDEATFQTDIHKEGSTGNLLGNGWAWTRLGVTVTQPSTVKIGFWSNCANSNWAGADNFTLTYYDSEANLNAALLAGAKEDAAAWKTALTGSTTTGALAAIQAEIDDANATVASVQTAVANARALPDIITKYNTIKAAAEALDDDATIFTGNATVDVSAADAALAAATDVASGNAAIAALRNAAATFLGAVTVNENQCFNITSVFLDNADFEDGNILGWETNYVSGQQATNIGYQGATYTNGDVSISKFIEAWRNGATLGDGYLRQTVSSLPEGKYVLEADAISVWQGDENTEVTGSYIYGMADGVEYKTALNTLNNKPQHFSREFLSTGAGDVIFGLKTESSTGNWLCADNFTVKFYGVDLSAYVAQLAEAVTAANAVTGIPTGAKSALDAVVTEKNTTYSTSSAYAEAISAIQEATTTALAFQTPYTNYNTAKETAETFTEASMFTTDWTTLQTAITSNTVDLTSTTITVDALNTATEGLAAANTAATAAVAAKTTYDTATTTIGESTESVDLTSLISNPSFESTAAYALVGDGWTNEGVGVQGQTNNGFDGYRVGNVFAERWANNTAIGAFKTYQTVTALPAGLYQVSVVATFNGDGASFYANGASVAITDATTYTLMVQVADKGSIELGLQAVAPTGSWFKADNFTLTYLPDFPAYTLATGKMGTDKSAAQTAAEAAFNADKTVANYNALLTAITEAEASVANYATLKTAIEKAEDVIAANNFVTAEATTAFQDEIDNATAAWTDVTYTDAEATTEIAVLGTAVSGWQGNKTGLAGVFMASAWSKTTENWWNAPYINTWSTEGDKDGSGFSVPFFEYFTDNNKNLEANTFTATMEGLENGRYEVEIWARVQRRSDADFNNDGSMITMSVNGGEAVSIMDNTSNNVGSGGSVMRLGRYTAVGDVTDGTLTLTIDVKLGSNVHWLSWRDVKYTKLDEVTMRIRKANKYGTFVAPFDVVKPADVEVLTVTGLDDNTLVLEEVALVEGKIPANTPVIINKEDFEEEDSDFETKFYGQATSTEETVSDGHYLTGVLVDGIYAPIGSYVLQNLDKKVAFYLVGSDENQQPKMRVNSAYLTLLESSDAKSLSFGDDEATAIAGIEALTSGNMEGIYTTSGAKVNSLQKGVNIIRTKDGKSMKVYVK